MVFSIRSTMLSIMFWIVSGLTIAQTWQSSSQLLNLGIDAVSDTLGNIYIADTHQIYKQDQSGGIEWSYSTNATIKAVAASLDGEVVVAGNFAGITDLDFTSGVSNHQAMGVRDMFYARYSSTGQFISAKVIPGKLDETVWDVELDENRSVVISCMIISAFDTVYVSQNSADDIHMVQTSSVGSFGTVFKSAILKYDSNDVFEWSNTWKSVGGCVNIHPPTIRVDLMGNIYSAYFGCDESVTAPSNQFSRYIYQKIDPNGNVLWRKLTSDNIAYASYQEFPSFRVIEEVEVDDNGSLYVLGSITLFVTPDALDTYNLIWANSDPGKVSFLAKYDSDGDHIWSQKIGALSSPASSCSSLYNGWKAYGYDIQVDYDHLFVVGSFSKTVDFDPNPLDTLILINTNHSCSNDSNDAFMAVYNTADGSLENTFQFSGAGEEIASLVLSDNIGGVHVFGTGESNTDVDPTNGVQLNTGDFSAYFNVCTPPTSVLSILSQDTVCLNQNVTVSGSGADVYYWNVLLDSSNSFTPNHSMSVIVKDVDTSGCYAWHSNYLEVLQPLFDTLSSAICQGDTFVFEGQSFTTTGLHTFSFNSSVGCDSLVTIDLAVMSSSFSQKVLKICEGDSVLINGNYENGSGIFYEHYQNMNGCDSTVGVVLQVQQPIHQFYQEQICEGESVWIAGVLVSEPGTYYETTVGSNGCDSLINQTTVSVQSVDASVQSSGNTLSANPFNDSYQWIDCATNQPIVGATGDQFTAQYSGSFALETSKNGCAKISECVDIVVVGLEELQAFEIRVYPNPTRESFVLKGAMNSTLIIQTLTGETIFLSAVTEDETLITTNQFAQGTYLIYVISEHYSKTLKLVVVE